MTSQHTGRVSPALTATVEILTGSGKRSDLSQEGLGDVAGTLPCKTWSVDPILGETHEEKHQPVCVVVQPPCQHDENQDGQGSCFPWNLVNHHGNLSSGLLYSVSRVHHTVGMVGAVLSF